MFYRCHYPVANPAPPLGDRRLSPRLSARYERCRRGAYESEFRDDRDLTLPIALFIVPPFALFSVRPRPVKTNPPRQGHDLHIAATRSRVRDRLIHLCRGRPYLTTPVPANVAFRTRHGSFGNVIAGPVHRCRVMLAPIDRAQRFFWQTLFDLSDRHVEARLP